MDRPQSFTLLSLRYEVVFLLNVSREVSRVSTLPPCFLSKALSKAQTGFIAKQS